MLPRSFAAQLLSHCKLWRLHEGACAAAISPFRPQQRLAKRPLDHLPRLNIVRRSALHSTGPYISSAQREATFYNLPHGPVRILFCGSDAFSAVTLRALLEEKEKSPHLVQSIEVLYRPAKRTGHGLKTMKYPLIHDVCQTLPGIRQVHQLDSFKSWDTYSRKPLDINLIIAVSFGLLIPAKVIESASYGGLNVHPSLLPDLPGAAPIHHTLLNRRTHTGVTVQTLHPTKFDAGIRLAQTPLPGIPVPENASTGSLISTLAEEGAQLLITTLRSGCFVEPEAHRLPDFTKAQLNQITNSRGPKKAPKITKTDSKISWATTSAQEILLKLRVFGTIWSVLQEEEMEHLVGVPCRIKPSNSGQTGLHQSVESQTSGQASNGINERSLSENRLLYEDISEVDLSDPKSAAWKDTNDPSQGSETFRTLKTWRDYGKDEGFPVKCRDGAVLLIRRCTLSGGRRGEGVKELKKLAARWEQRNAL